MKTDGWLAIRRKQNVNNWQKNTSTINVFLVNFQPNKCINSVELLICSIRVWCSSI